VPPIVGGKWAMTIHIPLESVFFLAKSFPQTGTVKITVKNEKNSDKGIG
jgi:hypothetical protein